MIDEVCKAISDATGEPFKVSDSRGVGGGCINQASKLSNGRRNYFVKFNSASLLSMFKAEAEGLADMAKSKSIRVPEPVASGVAAGQAYLVLTWIEFGRAGVGSWEKMGEQLAAMHKYKSRKFGFRIDNTIGSTPQPNDESSDWVEFYASRRLEHQFRLAGCGFRGEKELIKKLPEFFSGYKPEPSLLHGDLWGGNASFDAEGNPVIFDPATYYGDREADVAMTELFGGFSSGFYSGYNRVWPLDKGYSVRKTLYNLYHIVNHYNLFGGGYASQAQSMIDKLLRL